MRTTSCRSIVSLGLAAAAMLVAAPSAIAGPDANTADLVPRDVLAAVQMRDGKTRVSEFRHSALLKAYLAGPTHAALELRPQFMQLKGGVYMFAGMTGLDPWTLAGQLLGREATIAIGPRKNGGEPYVLVVIKADDDAAMQRIFNAVLGLNGIVADAPPDQPRSKEIDGVRRYKLKGDAFVARFDGFVVFCNDADTLEWVIANRASKNNKLAGDQAFRRAAKLAPEGAAVWAFVNVVRIRDAMGQKVDQRINNALGAALIGGWVEAFRSAEAAAVWLGASDRSIELSGRLVGGKPAGDPQRAFAVKLGERKDWSRFQVPGQIARFEVSRDWFGLWEARESMLNPDGLRNLASFAGTLTTLMGNLDFSSELLAGLNPTWRLLVARQKFDEDKKPTPELPGFALLLHLKSPDKMATRLENAALMALSILNVDRGQKMQPQYHMGMHMHEGTKIVTARFLEQTEPGPRGMRHNFEPSFAAVADHFILCSSKQLLEDTIDELKKLPDAAKAAGAATDTLRINIAALKHVLEANREMFVSNRMIEKDEDRKTAAGYVSMFLEPLKYLKNLSVTITQRPGDMSVSARIGLNVGD